MSNIPSLSNLLKLAGPIALSQSAMIVSGIIDLAFIGPFGTDAIAAVSVANVLCVTLINFFEGLRTGTTVLIANAISSHEKSRITDILHSGLFISIISGGMIALTASQFSPLVYRLLGNHALALFGSEYLKIWLWAIPFTLIYYVFVGFFRGLGDTVTPLLVTILICTLNVLFDYLFVIGGFGISSMGIAGAAWATLLAYLLGTVVFLAILRNLSRTAGYWSLRKAHLSQIVTVIPIIAEIGFYTGFMNFALVAFVCIMSLLGPEAMAAHQITLQVFLFSYLPSMGFLVAASIFAAAAKNEEAIVLTVRKLCKINLTITTALSMLLYLFAPDVASAFSPTDPTVVFFTIKTLRLVCFAQLFTSVYMVLRGVLTGCKDTRFIAYTGMVTGYLIFLPTAFLFAITLGYGILGGYVAFLIWAFTDCLVLAYRFSLQRNRWLTNQTRP